MGELYDIADVRAAVKATRRVRGGTIVGLLVEHEVRRVLDAVAPAIAARALRQIATDLPWTYNQASGLPDHAERLAAWVNRRADEIEAGR